MKTEQFLERYKKAIERLTILCSFSKERKLSLKDVIDFDKKIAYSSESGDEVEITVGDFLDSFNADVVKAFKLDDVFLQAIGAVLEKISDEQIERLIVECEELFTDNGLAQSEIAMAQIQFELFETPLAEEAQEIAAKEFGLALESGEGWTMTPMQSAIYIFHGDVFRKLMTAQSLIRNVSQIINALSPV